MCILLPTTQSIGTQTQTMQWMSPCLLLRKKMSKGTLEEEVEWTQEVVQKKSKIIISKIYTNVATNTKKIISKFWTDSDFIVEFFLLVILLISSEFRVDSMMYK